MEPDAPVDEEPTDEELDRYLGRAYRVTQLIGAVLSVWVVWDYMKDSPDVLEIRAKVKETISRQLKRLRKSEEIRKAEGQTVWEAMQIVEGAENV